MGYITNFYDEIKDLVTAGESVVNACRIIKKKYKIKRPLNGMRIAFKNLDDTLSEGKPKKQKVTTRSKSKSQSNNYKEKPFVLSAWNAAGHMMDIDEYCAHYKLPKKDITSYKLVSHTGTPYYNIVFKENYHTTEDFTFEFIEAAVKKHVKPITVKASTGETNCFDRVVYSDVHIGMHVNKSGHALYGGDWDEVELNRRLDVLVDRTIKLKKGSYLVIDDLADLLDGWDGKTVRKGHDLPQNMDNAKAFDVAVSFKVKMIDALVQHYDKILVNNICEDNHAGSFGYVVNSAVKQILDIKYKKNVEVNNHRKFINHYYVGNHCFVITHGKDSKNLKFGFKPHLDPKQLEKIDQYLKQNEIFKKCNFIEFGKGDSHQMLLDYCTSDDFDYFNYPAFSPASEWVQTNFKKGRSGFVNMQINYITNDKTVVPYFFK